MSTAPRRILLCSATPTHFSELSRLASVLERRGGYELRFWLSGVPDKLEEAAAHCRARGYGVIRQPFGAVQPYRALRKLEELRWRGVSRLRERARRSVAAVRAWWTAPRPARSPLAVRFWSGFWARVESVRAFKSVVPDVLWRAGRAVFVVLYAVLHAVAGMLGEVARLCGRAAPSARAGARTSVRAVTIALAAVVAAVLGAAAAVVGALAATSALALLCVLVLLGARAPWPLRALPYHLAWTWFRVRDRRLAGLLAQVDEYWWDTIRRGRKIVRRYRPELIVVAEDSAYDYAGIMHAGRERGIATVVVPFNISTAAEPAGTIRNKPDFLESFSTRSTLPRLTASVFPRWALILDGERMLRLPYLMVLALEKRGLAPPLPWVFNSGLSQVLAAESEHMAQLYLTEGYPRERMVVTGALYDDALAAGLAARDDRRRQLLAELGLAGRSRLVLLAIPPQVDLTQRPGCTFATHREIAEWMVGPLADRPDTAVAVSLHPTLRRDDYAFLERPGVRLSTWNTADLIPCCDLYVASITSTIRMAIACGIPVLNFDPFLYHYPDFDTAGGVITQDERGRFHDTLRRLLDDSTFFEEMRARQRLCAPAWGTLDGGCAKRMAALLDRLMPPV